MSKTDESTTQAQDGGLCGVLILEVDYMILLHVAKLLPWQAQLTTSITS